MKKFYSMIAVALCSLSAVAAVRKGPYLIYENTNTAMSVLWQLDSTQNCTLRWGTTTSYTGGSATSSEYGNDYQHKYTITGLQPGTKYYYQIDGVGTGSFVTAPPDNASRVKLFAYGDTRTNPSIHDGVAAQMLSTLQADGGYQTVALFSGDYIHDDTEVVWQNEFFPRNEPNILEFQSKVPIMGAIGNHELNVSGNGAVFRKYFPYPFVNHFYYSYDYGPVHVSYVDQYTSYAPGSAQYTWLENDLATSQKPWKMIVLHEPGWSAGGHSNNSSVKNYIQPLCTKYGVSFVVSGHNHYYARCLVDGVHHVTTGGGGAPTYDPSGSADSLIRSDKLNHFCTFDIDGNQLVFTAIQRNGSVIETFQVTRGARPPVANAGGDQIVVDLDGSGTEPVMLDGSGSFDSDGTIQSYSWTEGSTQIASGETPAVSLALGAHTITLTVTDNDGATATATVNVSIYAAGKPITVSSRISSGADDVEESIASGAINNSSTDLEMVYDNGTSSLAQLVGLRFPRLSIPQGATISDATIQFACDETSAGAITLLIDGEKADNASPFRPTAYDVSTRARTIAQVSWNPPDWNTVGEAAAAQKTPNLASVVQEITDRTNWKSGNALVLFVSGSGQIIRVAESYDGDITLAPELVVTYTVGSAPTNLAPTADAGADQTVTDTDSSGAEDVTLDASGSSDGDGTMVSYVWEEGSTQIATGVSPTVSFGVGTHDLILTVTDNDNASSTDTVTIVVNASGSVATGTVAVADAAQIDVGAPDIAQPNTGLRSIKYGSTAYTRYILARFDVSQLIGVDVISATLNINVKHDDPNNQLSTSITAFSIPDGNSGQTWSGGTDPSDITWNSAISSGLIPDLGTGLPSSYGQLIPVGQSPAINYGDNGWTTISSSSLADQLDADTDGKISILFAQELGYNVSVRDPLTIRLDFSILPATSGFTVWAAANGLSGLATDDADGDGVEDLIEYALNLDPTNSASATTIELKEKVGSQLTFRHPLNTQAADVTVELMGCDDLIGTNWVPVNTVSGGMHGSIPNTEWKEYTVDSVSTNAYFLKIRATK